jgi:hypothetical protein
MIVSEKMACDTCMPEIMIMLVDALTGKFICLCGMETDQYSRFRCTWKHLAGEGVLSGYQGERKRECRLPICCGISFSAGKKTNKYFWRTCVSDLPLTRAG